MKQLLFLAPLMILSNLAIAQSKETLTIHFEFNKYDLTAEAVTKLNDFVTRISQSPVASIEIKGYCDSKGTNMYNDALSLKRVNTITHYLESFKNLHTDSLRAKGLGENSLLNSDATEEERQQNRRVEIVALLKTASIPEVKKESESLTSILEDTAVKKGAVVTLPNLLFENNSDLLLATSIPTLKELLTVLIQNPKIKISIEGHICCVPQVKGIPLSESPNFQVSVLRAKMVFDYLLKNGIGPDRVTGYTGFGSSRPVYPIPEKSAVEIMANRRVEIRILEK